MKKADVVLLIVLLVIGVAGCILFMVLSETGAFVTVMVDGVENASYSLKKEGEYLIETKDGGENLLRIENGYASVVSANCPNLDCVNHKAISEENESIICLPHKVVITILDSDSEASIDAYVQ